MAEKTDHTADAPRELKVFDLARSHSKEIRALTQAIANVHRRRNTAQAIPHYMRRRASSHNANRLPQKVKIKIEQLVPDKSKKPSRYYRRRPRNLREEYARRQRRVNWLETHLWHAKRFHMIEKWGYKLPNYSTEKGLRSSHRAVIDHCLLQDQSYIHCIEVKAHSSLFMDTLKSLISESELGDGVIERCSGGLEVLYCTFYQPGQYPAGALCPVEIMFNPQQEDNTQQAWVWCHTIAVSSVWNVLCQAFNVVGGTGEDIGMAVGKNVSLKNLQHSLVRFKLNGKKTFEILTRAITPMSTNPSAVGAHVWWTDKFAEVEGEITSDLRSALKCWYRTNGTVASVRARDPRLCMPSIISLMKEKRIEKEKEPCKAVAEQWSADELGTRTEQEAMMDTDEENTGRCESVSTSDNSWVNRIKHIDAANSALWYEEVRDKVSGHVMSQHEINQRRSQLLVPGSEMSLGDEESCVPLLLVVHENMAEIILPANWALPFWLALTYSGARSGGLREERMICTYTNRPYFPTDFPDTKLCEQQSLDEGKSLCTQHFKYPPNKRPNFDKLRTNSPFCYDWKGLLSDDSPVVLRDRQLLELLSSDIFSCAIPEELSAINLVRVTIRMLKRGIPQPRAEICLPTAVDISDLREKNNSIGPTVESHKIKYQRNNDTHTTLSTERISSSREVVGFVTAGIYSLAQGSARGLGLITVQSLIDCSNRDDLKEVLGDNHQHGLLCLIRSPDSVQYRFALINILSFA